METIQLSPTFRKIYPNNEVKTVFIDEVLEKQAVMHGNSAKVLLSNDLIGTEVGVLIGGILIRKKVQNLQTTGYISLPKKIVGKKINILIPRKIDTIVNKKETKIQELRQKINNIFMNHKFSKYILSIYLFGSLSRCEKNPNDMDIVVFLTSKNKENQSRKEIYKFFNKTKLNLRLNTSYSTLSDFSSKVRKGYQFENNILRDRFLINGKDILKGYKLDEISITEEAVKYELNNSKRILSELKSLFKTNKEFFNNKYNEVIERFFIHLISFILMKKGTFLVSKDSIPRYLEFYGSNKILNLYNRFSSKLIKDKISFVSELSMVVKNEM